MRIEKAKKTGFCFGVRRALKLLDEAVEQNGGVETLGPVVHNQRVVDSLSQKGVRVVGNVEGVTGKTVAITSHGVPPSVMDELKERGYRVIDTTCPNVQKAQQAARGLAEAGFEVIVYGDPDHPEVRGILGWAAGNGVATLDPEVLVGPLHARRLGLLSQTTRDPEAYGRFANTVVDRALPEAEEIRIVNTLCPVTRKRQHEALLLARQVDLMIVVGGRNSANTRCLAEICQSTGTETHHIETAEEIVEGWLEDKTSIGVTTGTSISDQITEEVMLRLREIRHSLAHT